MKKNPYALMIDCKPIAEVLAAINASDEDELSVFARRLSDGELVQILDKTSRTYRKLGIKQTLISGALLHIVSVATKDEDRKEMFDLLLLDMEVSESQGYRCINSYRYFGTVLLKNEKLQQAFVVESLKLLSEPKVTEEARKQALEMAERGERITIKKAKSLIAPSKPSPKGKPTQPRSPRKRPSLISKFKSLVDKVVSEFQKPQPAVPSEDVDVLIDRLEGLLGQLKARRLTPPRSANPTRREHVNV